MEINLKNKVFLLSKFFLFIWEIED